MNEVLPKPEKLNGTRSCELAALLVTMGFTPADRQMSIATGQGVPGGSLGYWRFLPEHPAKRYSLRAVIAHGLDAYQAAKPNCGALPIYPEQAYIAAAFHNYRLMVESVTHGTRLRLTATAWQARPDFAPVYVFERVEARGVAELPGAEELRQFRANGTRNTELAAALATLGFTPGDTGKRIAHEVRGHVWLFPERSADGRYSLQERMARWADDAWCAQEGNTDPIAAMADAFWNLRHLRRSLRDARVYVQAQNGDRTVLVRRDASAETWAKAEAFLTRK
ncbi:MAG: hypothetical protein IKZ07_03745 [Akkermansia sp.]|nr:hypothetical protein [Akkermansia sp.]